MARLRWNEPIWNRTQAIILWGLAAAGIVNELFLQPSPRPTAYPLIFGLLAIPPARAWDKARQIREEMEK